VSGRRQRKEGRREREKRKRGSAKKAVQKKKEKKSVGSDWRSGREVGVQVWYSAESSRGDGREKGAMRDLWPWTAEQ